MKLNKFRVTNFRSIQDSGWVECNDVTTLVGINESGKSNLLLALWKLGPARGGEIDILHDMPVSKLSSLRNKLETTPFICGEFTIDEDSADYGRRPREKKSGHPPQSCGKSAARHALGYPAGTSAPAGVLVVLLPAL